MKLPLKFFLKLFCLLFRLFTNTNKVAREVEFYSSLSDMGDPKGVQIEMEAGRVQKKQPSGIKNLRLLTLNNF